MRSIVLTATLLALLSGCSRQSKVETVTPFLPVADIHEVMVSILDPAADVIWGSAGTIITAEGSRELAPTTDEGWQDVARNALIIAESGNLMMMPGRAAGPDWIEFCQGLITAGVAARDAANAHDSDGLFDAGGRLYQVCLACHSQYIVDVEESGT